MAFELVPFVRSLHVISAALWAGGAFFAAFVLGPHLAAAGPAAGAFMSVVVRRGGFTWFFAAFGLLTIVTGGYVYSEYGYASDPFGSVSRASVTVGAILALLAFLHGAAAMGPGQARMKKFVLTLPAGGPPTAAQTAELQRMGKKQGRAAAVSAGLIVLALLTMTLRVLF